MTWFRFCVSVVAPSNGPHYTMADVCAASTLLNKGGATALDLLGAIPGENTILKGAQFLGGLVSAGMTIFSPSSPTDAVLQEWDQVSRQ